MHPLDRPAWHALTTLQSAFAVSSDAAQPRAGTVPSDVAQRSVGEVPRGVGSGLVPEIALGAARRFVPEVGPIGAARDDSEESLAALADLTEVGPVALLQTGDVPVPRGTTAELRAPGVQMTTTALNRAARPELAFVELTDADSPEMIALAALTRPGPFSTRTHHLGQFIGIKVDGRLAAMAGERLRLPGFSEVSGICTHPDFRGRGYAESLSRTVADRILARGETPFLHAYAANTKAIALYQSMGFTHRVDLAITFIKRSLNGAKRELVGELGFEPR